MRKVLIASLVIATAYIVGCAAGGIDEAIAYHDTVAGSVQLGMSERSFLSLMQPALLQDRYGKKTTRFSRGESMYVVHYARSQRIADGESTDDEFTPYIFRDSKLVAVGWELRDCQSEAQDARLGLWADEDPLAPWDWRKK